MTSMCKKRIKMLVKKIKINKVSHNEDYEENNNKIIQLLDLNLLEKKRMVIEMIGLRLEWR